MPKKDAVKNKKRKSILDDILFDVEVRLRAYELYVERKIKGTSGDELSDWFQAEKELKAKYGI